MKNKIRKASFLILFTLLVLPLVQAQEVAPQVTFKKQPLLILPSSGGDDPNSVESKLTQIVATEATNLGRYDVIDRSKLKNILQEQALQMTGIVNDSVLVDFGRVAGAKEGMVINLLNFNQKGVPSSGEDNDDDKDGSNFFDVVIAIIELSKDKDDSDPFPNNIQTVITFSITKLDIETGQSIDSYYIDVDNTGGNRAKSLKNALAKVRSQVSLKLRGMYTLTSQIVNVNDREVTLYLGSEMGVKKGTLFEISSLDRKKAFQGREISVPGHSVALVRVVDLSPDANRSLVIRKWGKIQEGYRAVEKIHFTPAGILALQYDLEHGNLLVKFSGVFRPLRKYNFKIGFQLGSVQDNWNTSNLFLGAPLGFCYNLIQTPIFSLGSAVTLPINLAFRRDDDHNRVVAFFTDPRIGLEANIMSAPRRDLFFSVEYVFGSSTGNWTYSKTNDKNEPVTYDAVWNKNHKGGPDITSTGLYLTAGIRFLAF
ncbi:MAG: hypothetical protein ACE5D2_05815 [Fidelibacterota bacterium]